MNIYKRYKCADGTEYINFTDDCYTVDEIIAFLEPHRGKKFYTGALEDPCLEISDEWVQLEELDFFMVDCPPEDNQQLADDMYEFFYNEDGDVAYEEDRLDDGEYEDEEGDE